MRTASSKTPLPIRALSRVKVLIVFPTEDPPYDTLYVSKALFQRSYLKKGDAIAWKP